MKQLLIISALLLILCLNIDGAIFKPHKDLKPYDFYTTGYIETSEQTYGSCVAIDSEWIITARHVVEDKDAFYTVLFYNLDPNEYVVTEIHRALFCDLALCRLNRPIPQIAPISSSKLSLKQKIYAAGYGHPLVDLFNPLPYEYNRNDRTVITNEIDGIDTFYDDVFTFSISCPELNSTPKGEGMIGPGDSGGGVYIYVGDKIKLVGISTSIFNGSHGLTGCFIALEPHRGWIESVVERRNEND